ncbi:hypothetical protein [Sphingobium abikonense]|uniref:hypothetical protein n=1 Tax=Sphingobium abikonense TaxID=86193 RepID=UPI0035198991
MSRKPIFDAIRIGRGKGFTSDEVSQIDAFLTGIGVPMSGASFANEEAFWVGVRKVTGSLDQQQVDIIQRLLSATSDWGNGWLAYAMATAWHESRFRPIEEWGKGKGKEYGKVNSTGKAPYGRGLVQLTWDANYKKADKELGLGGKLAANYDLALDPDIAVRIMVRGMEEGWFTGKSLGDYMTKEARGLEPQFVQGRRIINGTDKAQMIADYAVKFQDALVAGGRA